MKEFLQFVKFGLFSVSAGVIQFASFSLLTLYTKLPYVLCYVISLLLSIIWNFTLNRKFTFGSSSNFLTAMLKTFAFYAVFTPLSNVFGDWLTDTVNEFLVTAVIMGSHFVTEFFYQKYYVFKD